MSESILWLLLVVGVAGFVAIVLWTWDVSFYILLGVIIGFFLAMWLYSLPPKPQSQIEPARIWSKICQKQGKDTFAWQADGGPWHIECVRRNDI